MGLVGFGILISAFASVGLLLYLYVKENPEDPFRD
jgi:hypothetical protein